jgi:hypothetical protein
MTLFTLVTAVIVSVSLVWTDVNTAPDQSEDGTAVYREIAGTFQQVGEVGVDATSFSDHVTASPGAQLCYHVSPFDAEEIAPASNEWCGKVPCKQKGNSGKCR